MSLLKEKMQEKIDNWRPRTAKLLKEYGEVKVCDVTISQIIGGMRDITSLTTDISYLDPMEGIRFRGYTIPEVLEKLPKDEGCDVPSVEAFYYLLLTGDIPNAEEIADVKQEFSKRRNVPSYVYDVLRAMAIDTHPMTMLSVAVLILQRESEFAKEYQAGMKKNDYWKPALEDSLNLLAKLPSIAAFIYRLKYKNGQIIPSDGTLDFGGDFAHMMGVGKPYDDVSRLYFILHSDHESGNVSAHAAHLVGSALSDLYYASSAMLDGLAGPLHGLANQEVLRWMQGVMEEMGNKIPTEEEMKKFVWDTLKSGQVIPGFGHAVLRKTDPRYMAQREFSLKHLSQDVLFKYADMLYHIVPPILMEQGKAKNPWPNIDAQSGVIQWHYGVKEYDFYTVMFGVGRTLGISANYVWSRALGYPLERPKSITTDMLEEIAGIK